MKEKEKGWRRGENFKGKGGRGRRKDEGEEETKKGKGGRGRRKDEGKGERMKGKGKS